MLTCFNTAESFSAQTHTQAEKFRCFRNNRCSGGTHSSDEYDISFSDSLLHTWPLAPSRQQWNWIQVAAAASLSVNQHIASLCLLSASVFEMLGGFVGVVVQVRPRVQI